MQIALTGATGYVGGRLAPHLLERGHRVRCLVRDARKLESRPWSRRDGVEVVRVDLNDPDSTRHAVAACDVAYYLVHSMESAGSAYAERDRRLATNFAQACESAGVKRIVYLGGLGELGDSLSEHLSSRREVEQCLASTSVPLTVLRAAMIIGSGSASFEILRYLVERLPIMITPRWVQTENQPIAIRNVLHYLAECIEVPETAGEHIDIGGPEVLTYRKLMEIAAEKLGLRRRFVIPVPLLTPKLSSLWIHLVTPISSRMARPLAEGLRNRVVCRDERAQQLMPQPLLTVRESIALALGKMRSHDVATTWSDAGVMPGDPDWAGGKLFTDERSIELDAPADVMFDSVCRVGGSQGYYAADWLWKLRGLMDRLIGGPGLRRGRRHPSQLAYGDALDFWRVTEIERPHLLGLRAEMIVPGVAMLEIRIDDLGNGRCRLTQLARFRPHGLLGLLYWWAVVPLHAIVFQGMLYGIGEHVLRHRKESNRRPQPEPQA